MDLKRITYRQKKLLTIGGIAVLALLVYRNGISNTIELASNCEESQQMLNSLQNAPVQIAAMESEIGQIDAILGEDGGSGEDKLLNFTTAYCESNRLSLREFPQPIIEEHGDYKKRITPLKVEGDFVSLLKMVHTLEQKAGVGYISSVEYATEKDFRNKKLRLTATIYVQNIERIYNLKM